MLNAIIIDDELHAITALRHDLNSYCPDVHIADTCRSGGEGILMIRKLKPDLVFLDIQMPLMNGFEMLEQVKDQAGLHVIFTTAYDQFTLRALRAGAMDYLLKPVDPSELQQAVERVAAGKPGKATDERLQQFLLNGQMPEEQRKIALPNRDGYEFVDPSEIIYCNAEGAYTNFVLEDGRTILVSRSLGEAEQMLPASLFERIHHSTIIHLGKIVRLKKSEGYALIMKNGAVLNVARSRKDNLLLRLGIK